MQEEKQLQQFFVTLQCYGKWKKDRLKTFNHFRNKYPELVTYVPLQDDDVMTACNKQHPNFLINIVWKIIVSRTGDVKPTFAMQAVIPTKHDNGNFLKNMQAKFTGLLKSVGIEKSIEVILLTMIE